MTRPFKSVRPHRRPLDSALRAFRASRTAAIGCLVLALPVDTPNSPEPHSVNSAAFCPLAAPVAGDRPEHAYHADRFQLRFIVAQHAYGLLTIHGLSFCSFRVKGVVRFLKGPGPRSARRVSWRSRLLLGWQVDLVLALQDESLRPRCRGCKRSYFDSAGSCRCRRSSAASSAHRSRDYLAL